MARPRVRSILLVVLGVVIGFVVAVGSGAVLSLNDAWFSERTDPEDIAAAGRLQEALEQAGREQPLLIDPSVGENPAGSDDYVLDAGLPDDTGLEEVLTVYDDVLATAGEATSNYTNGGSYLHLRWTVAGRMVGVEVGVRFSADGVLRTGLTTALAAVRAGAEYAGVQVESSSPAVNVEWGEVAAADLSASRPDRGQNPEGDAITYIQKAHVDRTQVQIRVEPGTRGLADADLAGWVTAAKDAGFTEVWLGASAFGVSRFFRLAEARSSADIEAAAPPLLAAVDQCDAATGTRLETAPPHGNNDVRLEYDCRDGQLAVREPVGRAGRKETDPEAAQRALDAARR